MNKKTNRIDTGRDARRRLANDLGRQVNQWMDIRNDHFLAEQEIGFLSSLMHSLRLGEVGRVRYARGCLEHSRGLIESHEQERKKPQRRRLSKNPLSRFNGQLLSIMDSYCFVEEFLDALSVLRDHPAENEDLVAEKVLDQVRELVDKREALYKSVDDLHTQLTKSERLHKKVMEQAKQHRTVETWNPIRAGAAEPKGRHHPVSGGMGGSTSEAFHVNRVAGEITNTTGKTTDPSQA